MNTRKNVVRQLMTVSGTGATSVTGVTLVADIISGTPTKIRIPQGLKLKVWAKNLSSGLSTDSVSVQYCRDGRSTTPTWVTIDKQSAILGNVTGAMVNIDKRRPMVVNGLGAQGAIQILPASSTAVVTYELEITNE
jgi:hypothetical protein